MINEQYIKWLGRTYYDDMMKCRILYHCCSGFTVEFFGTSLSTILQSSVNDLSSCPYFVIVIDNDWQNAITKIVTPSKTKVILCDNLTYREHTVSIYKKSESIDSHIKVFDIQTDGTFVSYTPISKKKIEVIGDSTTTGYGNLGKNGELRTIANSDGLQAFPFIVAKTLDAELSQFSASGWGVSGSPFTTPSDINICDQYKYIDVFSTIPYDFTNFTPDIVIISLGTNDYCYIESSRSIVEKNERTNNFIDKYINLVNQIHCHYPKSQILMVYGLMNEMGNYHNMNFLYNKLIETRDYISILQLTGDGTGADGHPSNESYAKMSNEIINQIKRIMNW